MAGLPPTRVQLAAAALVTAALVAYASLGPLQLLVGPRIAWRVLAQTWPPVIGSKTDFLSNVLLQLPLGFLIAGAIAADRPARRNVAVVAVTVLCSALAVAIELAQVSIPSRNPQVIDVVAESAGAFAGALCWIAAGDRLLTIVRRWWQVHGEPTLAMLLTYAAGWTLWQWVPFDFTIRPAEIAGKYRAGLIGVAPALDGFALAAVALAVLAAVPIGVAAARAATQRRSRSWAVLAAGMWVLLSMTGQLAVLSRSTTLLSVAAALAGCTLGVVITAAPIATRVVR